MNIQARTIFAESYESLEQKVNKFLSLLDEHGWEVIDTKNYEALIVHPDKEVLELFYSVVIYSNVQLPNRKAHIM